MLKPYKATIEVVFAAPSEVEAKQLLGFARLGSTGSLPVALAPEVVSSEVKELQRVPTDTRLHDLMDKQKAEE